MRKIIIPMLKRAAELIGKKYPIIGVIAAVLAAVLAGQTDVIELTNLYLGGLL